MANRTDSNKIKIIRTLKARAKAKGINRYELLAKNDELYKKAIESQHDAGLFTLFCCVLGLIASILVSVISSLNSGDPIDVVSYIIICVVVLGITIPTCSKTMSLTTTPTVILILTIIQLAIALFMFFGIIPLIAVIYNVVALVRWSTYRNWYNEISIDFYKSTKKVSHSASRIDYSVSRNSSLGDVYNDYDIDNDSKKPTGLIISLVLCIVLGIASSILCFFGGRNSGWNDGYAYGKGDGYSYGYDVGFKDAESKGFTSIDLNNSYDKGYQEGYRKAGCVIYGINCD